MTPFEKQCYNAYLATTRSAQNKPFKIRKDFTNFESKEDYPYVKKLCYFFTKFPQITPRDYFLAPFKVYPDERYFDLKFYTSQRAIKTYSMYMKQIQDQLPDSEIQLEFIKRSLRTIANFCIKNKIHLEDYINHRPASTYSWMKHLKNHEISIYSLFGFKGIQQILNETPNDELQLLMGTNLDDFYKYKTRFHNSTEAKNLVTEGVKRLQKYTHEYYNKK